MPLSSRLKDRLLGAIKDPRFFVILLPFILLAPLWAQGQALYWGTPATQFVPWWVQAWNSIAQGELPLWNPLLGMGTPLLANVQSALLYPGTWIYFLLYQIGGTTLMAWGIAPMLATHLAIAALGMMVLLRGLGLKVFPQAIGGMAFSLSAYLVARAHFLSINASLAWLPWILWAGRELLKKGGKREIVILAFLLAIQWLAGHAQIAAYSLMLMIMWLALWIWKEERTQDLWKKIMPFGAVFLIALGLSAVQWIPTLELLLNSQRALQVNTELALTYSFWPWRALTLIFPNFFGNPAFGNYWGYGNFWEDTIYVGLLPLLLAIAWIIRSLWKRKFDGLTLFLVLVGMLSLLLALGKNTPFFPWLFEHVPTFDLFQAPTRFSIWLVWGLAMLAALGASKWKRPKGRGLYWSRLGLAAAIAILLMGLLGRAFESGINFQIPSTFIIALIPLGLLATLLATLNLKAPKGEAPQFSSWHWAVLAVIAIDLLWAGWGLNPGIERSFYDEGVQHASIAQYLDEGERSYMPPFTEQTLKFEYFFPFSSFSAKGNQSELREFALPNLGILDAVPAANNFDPLLICRYSKYLDVLDTSTKDHQTTMLQAMNVGAQSHWQNGEILQIEELNPWGRWRWVPCARNVNNAASASKEIAAHGQMKDVILVEAPFANDQEFCDPSKVDAASIELKAKSNNDLQFHIKSSSPGWLFIADTFYPGWKAFINDEEQEIVAADLAFRAIKLPVGEIYLEIVYRPLSFYLGAGLSSMTFLILGIQSINRGKRKLD